MTEAKYDKRLHVICGEWWLHKTPDSKKSSRICRVKDGTKAYTGNYENGWMQVKLETGEEGYLTGKVPYAW